MSPATAPPREPSRIIRSDIAIMPSGDLAELVTDSRGNSWGRWFSAGARSWSAWRHIPGKPEAAAITGPYTDPAQVAASTPEAALVAVVGRSPDERQFFLLTATGLAPIRL